MGEEAKPEQAPADAKTEEKANEKKEEPEPPAPVVLSVDLHCVGCAKKIERSIMRVKGVEGVVMDMGQNQVTIKGTMDPQAVCDKITKRTKRKPKLLSPLPPPPPAPAEAAPAPEPPTPQVTSAVITVELNVNMHCEACSEQLKRKILQMKGVQTAQTEVSSGKVVVTGTMDAEKLVEYVYRRTRKQAKIVPQPEPEKQPDGDKSSAEEPKGAEEEKKEENPGEKPSEDAKKEEGSENKEEQGGGGGGSGGGGEETPKEGGDDGIGGGEVVFNNIEDESLKRMIYYYQPLYVIERIPPPQLFSDENPNACCIS